MSKTSQFFNVRGKIARVGELRVWKDKKVCDVVVTTFRKTQSGDFAPTFYKFTLWGKQAEVFHSKLAKGMVVEFFTRNAPRVGKPYQKDGKWLATIEFPIVDRVEIISAKDMTAEEIPQDAEEYASVEDDIVISF